MSKSKTPTKTRFLCFLKQINGMVYVIVPSCYEAEADMFTFTINSDEGEICYSPIPTGLTMFDELMNFAVNAKQITSVSEENIRIAVVHLKGKDFEEVLYEMRNGVLDLDILPDVIFTFCVFTLKSMLGNTNVRVSPHWGMSIPLVIPLLSTGEIGSVELESNDFIKNALPRTLRKSVFESKSMKLREDGLFFPIDVYDKLNDQDKEIVAAHIGFKSMMEETGKVPSIEANDSAEDWDEWEMLLDEKHAEQIWKKISTAKPIGDKFRHFAYPYALDFSFAKPISIDEIRTFINFFNYITSGDSMQALQKKANEYFPKKAVVYEGTISISEVSDAMRMQNKIYRIDDNMKFSEEADILD